MGSHFGFGHLVSRRPKTTLLPILVKACGFIFSFRLEASLNIILLIEEEQNDKIKNGEYERDRKV